MPYWSRMAAGKSRWLFVTMTCAPHRIAAAEDMAVIRVGKAQRSDEVFIARDQAIWYGLAHQFARAAELSGVLGLACYDGAFHFFEDALGPASPDQPCLCEPDEEIPLGCRMEHICVEYRCERHPVGLSS